jgi:prepilin signal peptidase PulO-like enzyme (type II secretory pathway)
MAEDSESLGQRTVPTPAPGEPAVRCSGGLTRWSIAIMTVLFSLLLGQAVYRSGSTVQGILALPTLAVLAVAALMDTARKVIPDWLTLPGLAWTLAASGLMGWFGVGEALRGTVVCGGLLLLLAAVSRGSIGGGDVKLMAVAGALLGWRWGLAALFLAQIAAALVAACLLIAGRKGRKDPLPFGPFLSTFAILATLAKTT